jgi:hypothetical protein
MKGTGKKDEKRIKRRGNVKKKKIHGNRDECGNRGCDLKLQNMIESKHAHDNRAE